MTAHLRFACAALIGVTALLPVAAAAQSRSSTIVGTVHATEGAPIGGATVTLRGKLNESTTTNAQGGYRFNAVPPGLYQIIVSKAGFLQTISTIAVAESTTVQAEIAITPQSFSSLQTIAHVSTNAPGYAHINQSTAAINTISSEVFQEQSQTQVMNVLNETPGISVWTVPEANNGDDQFSPQTIQIRGALPYETESLIDGHATPLSLTGYFDPSILNPAVLQSVEVVKGPGSEPPEINYAIGGTVNFITLEPTRTPQAALSEQLDNWGGLATAIRLTGSTPSNFLQYAFAYATNGAPGPMQNYQEPGSAAFLSFGDHWTANGQSLAALGTNLVPAPEASYNRYVGFYGQFRFAESLYVCCYAFNTAFDSKNELGKVRLNFSQNTSLTLSFLGAQDFGPQDNAGVATSFAPIGELPNSSVSSFAPPAGYTGSVPAGTPMPFDLSAFLPAFGSIQQYLYQAEFRTTLGPWTALLRYYDGGNNDYTYLETSPSGYFTIIGKTWGGAELCPGGTAFSDTAGFCEPGNITPTTTYFNGQKVTFAAQGGIGQYLINNHELGESLQFDRPFGNGSDLTLSLDRHSQAGSDFTNVPLSGVPPYYSLPPGASQLFDTESARFDFFLAPRVQVDAADYFIQYESHFTDNGGGFLSGSGPAAWKSATRGYNAPRVGITWQPNGDTSWRFALGSSIAPPYLSLLSSPGTVPQPIILGYPPAGYIEDLNNGNIAPETAFGYDIGVDRRMTRSLYVSLDGYLTDLHDMYLPSTFLVNPDYFPAGCPVVGDCPLYGSETENLGHARYEGVEAAIGDAPAVGLGFRLQGDLMRAYAYDLPQGFYCSNVPANKCAPYNYDTNLGIIPGINFQSSGISYNTINGVAVPYSMGYAELNYRMLSGPFFRVGATYFGPNNMYSVPPFFVVSAGIREPIGPHLALQLSANNLNGADDSLWPSIAGGIPAILAPECVGKYGTPAYLAVGSECTAAVATGVNPATGATGVTRSDVAIVRQDGLDQATIFGGTTFWLQLIEQIGGP
jgi:hypothetical protein